MPFMQAVTDAIANPKQVRLSQERASARALSALEPKMKAIRDTSPECMPGVVGVAMHRTESSFSSRATSQLSSRETSRAPSLERSASTTPAMRPTAQLQRSQSELPFKSPVMRPQEEFPPDITTMSLTTDQMKRNYSCDDLLKWDRSKFPLPPMNPMRGFGRYRRAVNADPEWCYANLKKQIKDIERLPLGRLDMGSISGTSTESWQALTNPWVRRDSVISSLSTATDSSADQLEAGTRISRGFSPSGSSARSSLNSLAHARKGSNLSTMNLPPDIDSPPLGCALKRTSTLLSERRSSGPLTTIEEMYTTDVAAGEARRKIEKPCDFTDCGDPDSAVASDAEDEDAWTDVVETVPVKVSAITQMIKEGMTAEQSLQTQSQSGLARVRTTSSEKKRAHGSTVALERNKTIRAARPDLKRKQSRNQNTHIRGKSGAKTEIEKHDEVFDESLQSSAGLELHIPDARKPCIKTQMAQEVTLQKATKIAAKREDQESTELQQHNTEKRVATALLHHNPIAGPISQQTHVAYAAK